MKPSARRIAGSPVMTLLAFSVPATLSLLVEMLTSVTDTLFAGHLPGQGAAALSAMTLAMPVLGIFTAIQSLFAMPIGILVAKHAANRRERDAYFFTATALCTVSAAAASAAMVALLDPIVALAGAQGETAELMKTYLRIQAVSNVLSAIGFSAATGIRALGHPIAETVLTTAAVAADIAFNFLFAFVLDMGFAGLAWGTLASEALCAACCVIWLKAHRGLPAPAPAFDAHLPRRCAQILKTGLAQAGTQILGAISGGVVNAGMAQTGMDHVAAWGIAQRIWSVTLMPIVGLAQGLQTVLARSDGMHDERFSRTATTFSLLLAGICAAACCGIVGFAGQGLTSAFGAQPQTAHAAWVFSAVCCAGLIPAGAAQILVSVLIVRDAPGAAASVFLLKQAAVIGAVALLCAQGSPSHMALALTLPATDALACAAAIGACVLRRRRHLRRAASSPASSSSPTP